MEITHKTRASFKTLASEKATAWRLKKSKSNNKPLWKIISSTVTKNKLHSSKQVVRITYTLVFAAATFKGLRVVSFQVKSKKLVVNTLVWLTEFLEVRRLNKYYLWEANLFFVYVDVWFDIIFIYKLIVPLIIEQLPKRTDWCFLFWMFFSNVSYYLSYATV